MTPKVSVIVPVYNSEQYLPQMLDSVLTQTLRDIEIICVDDGSADRSCEILKDYAENDARIRLFSQQHANAGEARNVGLDHAEGEYLIFLDADDFFEKEMLEECVAVLERENSDIVIFSAIQYDDRTGESTPLARSLRKDYLPDHIPFTPAEMQKYLFNAFQNWPWNKVFRRSFIERENIRFQSIQRTNDMAFVCEALAKAGLISILDREFTHYRIGTSSNLQATNHLAPRAFWEAYLETRKRLIDAQLYEQFEQSYVNWVIEGALYNIRVNKQADAKEYARGIVKFEGEKEFGFLQHEREYYYKPQQYDEYSKILETDNVGALQKEIAALKADNKKLKDENKKLRDDAKKQKANIYRLKKIIQDMKKSVSFRIGRVITWVPRKIKKVLQNKKTENRS